MENKVGYDGVAGGSLPLEESNESDKHSPHSESTVSHVVEVGSTDVLCGRGTGPSNHKGNINFRRIVEITKKQYVATASRRVKNQLVQEVVDKIKREGGRFLRQLSRAEVKLVGFPPQKVLYEAVPDSVAIEKVKQAIRYVHYKKEPNEGRANLLLESKVVSIKRDRDRHSPAIESESRNGRMFLPGRSDAKRQKTLDFSVLGETKIQTSKPFASSPSAVQQNAVNFPLEASPLKEGKKNFTNLGTGNRTSHLGDQNLLLNLIRGGMAPADLERILASGLMEAEPPFLVERRSAALQLQQEQLRQLLHGCIGNPLGNLSSHNSAALRSRVSIPPAIPGSLNNTSFLNPSSGFGPNVLSPGIIQALLLQRDIQEGDLGGRSLSSSTGTATGLPGTESNTVSHELAGVPMGYTNHQLSKPLTSLSTHIGGGLANRQEHARLLQALTQNILVGEQVSRLVQGDSNLKSGEVKTPMKDKEGK